MEKLSSPIPSEQNIQIKRLLNDMREAISPLLPSGHQLLHVLSLPPAPSTAPLYSFIGILRDVLIVLRQRCAPLRDNEIDAELQNLQKPPPNEQPFSQPQPKNQQSQGGAVKIPPAAKFVVQSLKAILAIVDQMKSDLHNFLLGSMTEEQLRALVIREAKLRERHLVIKLWSPCGQTVHQRGEATIREQWRSWCRLAEDTTIQREDKWKSRLMKAIAMSVPISCVPPQAITSQSPNENQLPPQFFFSAPSLYRLQDYLQAVVIAATLRSLTRLPPPSALSPTSTVQTSSEVFMQRIWNLLQTELEDPVNIKRPEDNPLKLVNLADEVVRARRLVVGTLDPSVEQRLREAVEWTLQPSDPVFVLLQNRLMDALLKGLITKEEGQQVPEKLKAGRSHSGGYAGKRPKLISGSGEDLARGWSSPTSVGPAHPIKGFEDPVLIKAIDEAFAKLTKIVGWIECIWGDLV